MKSLQIIKIGGNVIDDSEQLSLFLQQFNLLPGLKLLVHGGGKKASEISESLGVKPIKIEGRRITDAATLDIVTMVYAGLINKKIVANLQGAGCNAIGLSGPDGNLIQATKRPVKNIDYGFAGDINHQGVNTSLLTMLLSNGFSPVVSAITHDGCGQLLNTNADTIATTLATALIPHFKCELIYCFEKPGVLLDPDDDTSCIEKLNYESYQRYLANHIITDGMIPKLDNAFEALKMGVTSVTIKQALAINNHSGTQITYQ